MKLTDNFCTVDQAVELKELGVMQSSTFYTPLFPSGRQNNEVYVRLVPERMGIDADYGMIDPNLYKYQNENCISRWTLHELGVMLGGGRNLPRYIAIWNEWGYRDRTGQPRAYEIEAHARAEFLIDVLKSGKLSVAEVNERLTQSAAA